MRASRAGRFAAAMGAVAVLLAAWTAPAGAAKAPNPCKLLKASEISGEFGGATVAAPSAGIKTAVSTSCSWDVAASATLPDGTVTASVMFVGGKAAYNGLEKTGQYAPVDGLKGGLYQDTTGALSVLDGANLVTVQGVFLEGPPIKKVDVLEQLIPLSKLATKRA